MDARTLAAGSPELAEMVASSSLSCGLRHHKAMAIGPTSFSPKKRVRDSLTIGCPMEHNVDALAQVEVSSRRASLSMTSRSVRDTSQRTATLGPGISEMMTQSTTLRPLRLAMWLTMTE